MNNNDTYVNLFLNNKVFNTTESTVKTDVLSQALGCSTKEIEHWIKSARIRPVNFGVSGEHWLFEESLISLDDDIIKEWRDQDLNEGIVFKRKRRNLNIIREYEAKEQNGISFMGEISFVIGDTRLRRRIHFFLKSSHGEEKKKKIALNAVKNIQEYYNSILQEMDEDDIKKIFHELVIERINPERGNGDKLEEFEENFISFMEYCKSKAYARFAQDITDLETIERTGIENYINLFPLARKMHREFIFHAGPTNSGKTYHAMKELTASEKGMYLAPLRLMAMEGYEKIKSAGLPAILKTGEELIVDEGATHTASTIEMMDMSEVYDVCIIDEVQMLFDPDRGWAWTQAIIGCPARKIIMTGSPEAREAIERLVSLIDDDFEWKEFNRLNELHARKDILKVNDLKPGDAIIAFSRKRVLEVHNMLTSRGINTACIYGSLSPEIRRQESKRFASGEADIIVATDAIGMGLNLPVKRVLFSSVKKYDGKEVRYLTPYELRQIAGRAGRYGHVNERGEAGLFLDENDRYPVSKDDYSLLKSAISGFSFYEMKNIDKFFVMPTRNLVEYVSEKYSTNLLNTLLVCHRLLSYSQNHFTCEITDNHKEIAYLVDFAGKDMPVVLRYQYMGCPVNINSIFIVQKFEQWMANHGSGEENSLAEINYKRSDMEFSEQMVNLMSAYIWLSMRWPEIYPDNDKARELRERYNIDVENYIVNHNKVKKEKKLGL